MIDNNTSVLEPRSQVPDSRSQVPGSDEINLLDYWRVIVRQKKMISGIVIAGTLAAMVISFLIPKTYKAEAVLIPVSAEGDGGGGIGALASKFGGLASLAGFNISGGAGDMDKILAVLKSRSLTETVIQRQNLMPELFPEKWDASAGRWKNERARTAATMEEAVKRIRRAVEVVDDKKAKTVRIAGVFRSPELTARVVNAYVEELQSFISANALTTAKRNRMFIEGQLAQNKVDLLEAGKEINAFYKAKGVSSREAELDVAVGDVSVPETNLSAKTKIAAMDAGDDASMRNLLAEKAEVEKRIADTKLVEDVPQQVYLTYLMLRRELLAKVNALLTTQYEMAKIEETKEDLTFQVIDWAVVPKKKAGPHRAQICIMSFMAALFLGIFLAFFREYLERMRRLSRETVSRP